ncbi:MAG TPA: PAS domain-containing protein [Kofleriaceae bacterium]
MREPCLHDRVPGCPAALTASTVSWDLGEHWMALAAGLMAAVCFPTSFAEFEAAVRPGVVLDLQGTIIALNANGARLLARPLTEVLGRMAWEFAPGLEHLWAERVAAARAPGGHAFDIAIVTSRGAAVLEYVVAVCELDGRPYVVSFGTGLRPLG